MPSSIHRRARGCLWAWRAHIITTQLGPGRHENRAGTTVQLPEVSRQPALRGGSIQSCAVIDARPYPSINLFFCSFNAIYPCAMCASSVVQLGRTTAHTWFLWRQSISHYIWNVTRCYKHCLTCLLVSVRFLLLSFCLSFYCVNRSHNDYP